MNYETERLNDILKKRLMDIEDQKENIVSLQKVIALFEEA